MQCASYQYRYECHEADRIVATGELQTEHPAEVGELFRLAGKLWEVESVHPGRAMGLPWLLLRS